MIGQTVSHYRIIEKLGEGGMGEVYRAEDTTLGRQVAIKVLPDLFAADPARLARFEREARLLAALNHPNIAAIYGLEQADGMPFLVLELIEGQTLAERLARGRIPLDETLEIFRQISEGLEAAHEKGIVHRDLKPANVKVTPDGKVKILDFGLAKAFQGDPSAPEVSRSPTLTGQTCHAGVVLGTAAYMSPEQAKGKPADKRADIWAFGCVLYECLTGLRAFAGETVTEAMASILKSDPNWALLPAETPPFVRSVLRQCLQKEPSLRLHDIADFRVEMQAETEFPANAAPVSRRLSPGWALAIAAISLAGGTIFGLAIRKAPQPAAPAPLAASTIELNPGYCLSGLSGGGRANPYGYDHPTRTGLAFSASGRFIVYSATNTGAGPQNKPRLYLREIHELEAKPIQGTEGGIGPFLSPDDQWIGFWADGKLRKVPVKGGVPSILCDVPMDFGFTWGSDNRIVFSPGSDTGLSSISAGGGIPEVLTTPDSSKEEYSHRLPHCLPGQNGILVTVMRQAWDMHPRIFLLEPATRQWRALLEDAADARYAPTGHLVFLRQGILMAAPFDLGRLAVTGEPVPATANVMQALNMGDSDSSTGAGQFSLSASGSLAYVAGGILPDLENSLVWVDQKGQAEPAAPFKAPFFSPRFSPDGRRIAYRTLAKDRQVWVYDLHRDTATRLTSEGRASYVVWSRDGQRLVFGWSKAGSSNLFWQAADGSAPMERLTAGTGEQNPGSWSPEGETLAFVGQRMDRGGRSIQLLRMRDRQVTPLLNSRFDETFPEFSPDGRRIAYVTNESGRTEVYVQAFPDPGGKWQISNKGGNQPLWSPNGRQLFYRWEDQVWVVDIQAGSVFFAGKPRLLFEQPGLSSGAPIRGWEISPDGRRFLMVKLEEKKPEPVTKIILIQNWFEELKRLCPTGR